MSIKNLGLLNGMHAKMGFLQKRQEVYAQNIANADTPGYRPKEIKAPDFSRVMGEIGRTRSGGVSKVKMESTDDMHMPTANSVKNPRLQKVDSVYEAAPDNNSVVLEEQMYKASRNMMDYQAITNIYRRNVGLVRLAVVGNK
jgi:flagellar basal-body rod protein FlgB